MVNYNLADVLFQTKIDDYTLNSGLMYNKRGIHKEKFSQFLGVNSGRVLSIYQNIFRQIEENEEINNIIDYTKKTLNKYSKVKFKVPHLGEKQVRICSYLALNHSKFFDNEINFYYNLMNDLKNQNGELENIIEDIKNVGKEYPNKYNLLLKDKSQSIYDFGVLMGINDNEERFEELKASFHKDIGKYFYMVKAIHSGKKLGFSWPLPFKKFSNSIMKGLYKDSIASTIQEGIKKDYGFSKSEDEEYRKYINKIKNSIKNLSFKKNLKKNLKKEFVPMFSFLYGMSSSLAYAQNQHEIINNFDLRSATAFGVIASYFYTAYNIKSDDDDTEIFLSDLYMITFFSSALTLDLKF